MFVRCNGSCQAPRPFRFRCGLVNIISLFSAARRAHRQLMPRLDKLFHVLVVLGAASCSEEGTDSRDRLTDATQSAGDAVQASDGVPAGDGAELTSCFCETDAC